MSRFPYDYKADVLGHIVFVDKSGKLDVVDPRTELLMTDRETGVHQKAKVEDIANIIKTVFPDRNEQKELLKAMFAET